MIKNTFNITVSDDGTVVLSDKPVFNKLESGVTKLKFTLPTMTGFKYLLCRHDHRDWYAIPIVKVNNEDIVMVGQTVTQFHGIWAFNVCITDTQIGTVPREDNAIFMSDVFEGLVYDNIASPTQPSTTEPNALKIGNDCKYWYEQLMSKQTQIQTNLTNTINAMTNVDAAVVTTRGYRDTAKTYRDDAESFKNSAETYKDSALASKNSAESAKNDAETYKSNAYAYKNAAEGFKNDAKDYRDSALSYKNAAESAKDDAETAKTDAENAKDTAVTSATNASNSESAAKAWAVGPSGTGSGSDTNNAKYWAERAAQAAISGTGANQIDYDQATSTLSLGADGVVIDTTTITVPQITVDSVLSDTSTNPLQNKVVKSALDNKVDKVSGKGLSTNDLTDALKAQYDAAEANVQSDWNETDNTSKAFILNKPSIDDAISDTSENAVQNKVVKASLDDKVETSSVLSTLSAISTKAAASGGLDDSDVAGAKAIKDLEKKLSKYETTEKVVGEYYDGRPIYRTTYTGTHNAYSTSGNRRLYSNLLDTGIDLALHASGYIAYQDPSNNTFKIPIYASAIDGNLAVQYCSLVNTSNGNLNLVAMTNQYLNCTGKAFAVTVDYVKL